MNELYSYMNRVAETVQSTLNELLPASTTYPESIHSVMRYSLFAGGKRLRPCLLMATNECCGDPFGNKPATQCACAIEMLHTFSLMHDDLPCMDNDDFRRGKPTAHRQFNEALAVLGGDALCIFAFEILARVGRTDIITEIASALGTQGMISGQVVDIESEGTSFNESTLTYIHQNKTAALIRASICTGALLASAEQHIIDALSEYGNAVGLAFQVVDDILDETGSTEQLGKDAGSDRKKHKATFPALFGIDKSKLYARALIQRACDSIAVLGKRGRLLKIVGDYIITRIS